MWYSRISVLLGPTRTAARTLSATETPPLTNAARDLGPGLDRSRWFSCEGAQARSRGWTAMETDAFDAAESEAGGSMPDGSGEVVEHAALLSQASRTFESHRPGEAMDARALQAAARRPDPRRRNCLRTARLSAAGDRGRVLDRRGYAASFQGIQARRRGRPRRPSSRLAEERADSGRRRRAGVLLSGAYARIFERHQAH